MATKNFSCIRWAVDLTQWKPSYQQLALSIKCIQQEERERLQKFVFREDFDASLVGRLLMRKFVSDTTNISYENIKFKRDERGKPFIENQIENYEISFNVSHQGNYSVLAGIYAKLGSNNLEKENKIFDNSSDLKSEIGIDIMKIEHNGTKPLSEFFRLMDRIFSVDEWHFIKKQLTEFDKLKAFMRNWCLKESYVKNVGVGITVDLKAISFNIESSEHISDKIVRGSTVKVNNKLLENWLFEEHLLDNDHCIAIAFKNLDDIEISNFKLLTFDELMENSKPLDIINDDGYCEKVFLKNYKTKQ